MVVAGSGRCYRDDGHRSSRLRSAGALTVSVRVGHDCADPAAVNAMAARSQHNTMIAISAFGIGVVAQQLGHVPNGRHFGFDPSGLETAAYPWAREGEAPQALPGDQPTHFPRIPQGDTISVMSRRLRYVKVC
jgi:hypothetical protein